MVQPVVWFTMKPQTHPAGRNLVDEPELLYLLSVHQWMLPFFVCLVGNPPTPVTGDEHSFYWHRRH